MMVCSSTMYENIFFPFASEIRYAHAALKRAHCKNKKKCTQKANSNQKQNSVCFRAWCVCVVRSPATGRRSPHTVLRMRTWVHWKFKPKINGQNRCTHTGRLRWKMKRMHVPFGIGYLYRASLQCDLTIFALIILCVVVVSCHVFCLSHTHVQCAQPTHLHILNRSLVYEMTK